MNLLLKKIIITCCFIGAGLFAFAQSSSNYTDSTLTTGSLAQDMNGNAIDMSISYQNLCFPGDDNASVVTNIGFDFWFMGQRFTQFSTNTNGYFRFGSTAISGTQLDFATSSQALISPFGEDLRLQATGYNRAKLVGTAPNRCLVVEWKDMGLNASSTTANGQFQLRIYETTGIIEFVYGQMSLASAFTGIRVSPAGARIGFSVGSGTGNNTTVVTPATFSNPSSMSSSCVNAYSTGTITALNSTSNGSRRVYRFIPPPVFAPTNLTFSNISYTSITLNWVDTSTEIEFPVYVSTDNINFTYYGSASQSSTATQITGLLNGTVYYFRIFAVSEGAFSTILSGSQSTATLAPLTGIKTIGGTTPNYPNFTAALTDLSIAGVGAGGVTFSVRPGVYGTNLGIAVDSVITISQSIVGASSANRIRFIKASGTVVIERYGTASSSDYVVGVFGASYVTFSGIDVRQKGSGNSVEYGYLISNNSTGITGSMFDTISNASIILNRTNQSSIGLFQTSFTTPPTSFAGSNSNNVFYNITIQNASAGVYLFGNPNYCDTNTVYGASAQGNSYIGSTTTNDIYSTTTSAWGIRATFQKNARIFNLTVRNITSTNGNSWGILIDDVNNTAPFIVNIGRSNIYNNMIYNINSYGYSIGMDIENDGSIGTAVIYNNAIYNVYSSYGYSTSNLPIVYGIRLIGTGVMNTEAYYNTVYLDRTAYSYPFGAAFAISNDNGNVIYQNNIFADVTNGQSNSSTLNYAVAIYKTANANITQASNNILYTASSLRGKVAAINTGTSLTYYSTLFQWKGYASNGKPEQLEQGTAMDTPGFVSSSNLTFATATPAALSATPITGITTDINGTTRPSTPTIGAFETTQPLNDYSAPKILNPTIVNGSSPAVAITISDNYNALQTAMLRLYYRALGSTSSYTALDADAKPSGQLNGIYVWFTSLASLSSGAYEFYILVRDSLQARGNISAYPSWLSSTSALTWDPPQYSTNPATTNRQVFVKTVTLAGGTYTVGSGSTYTNLTAVANALRLSTLTGNVIFEIQSGYTSSGETFPITFYPTSCNGGNWNVTIRPAAGVSMVNILGNSSISAGTQPMIILNGINRLRIDGRPGGTGNTNAIKIDYGYVAASGTTSNTSFFQFINGASFDTLNNLIFLANGNGSTIHGFIDFTTSNTGIGNSNNVISRCTFLPNINPWGGSGTYIKSTGINSKGTSGQNNNSNEISYNNFVSLYQNGVNIDLIGNGDGWKIIGNHFYDSIVFYSYIYSNSFINLNSTGNGNVVYGNYIGGTQQFCGGTALSSTCPYAININVGILNTTNIDTNTIQNITFTNSTQNNMINVANGLVNIGVNKGNVIGHPTVANSIVSSYCISGIYSVSDYPINISNNFIGNMKMNVSSSTSLYYIKGINVRSNGDVNINNNQLYKLINASGGISSQILFVDEPLGGIYVTGNIGNVRIENNAINSLEATTQGPINNVAGIGINGKSKTIINANKISNVYTTMNMAGSFAAGIAFGNTNDSLKISNNQISLGQNYTGAFQLYGIMMDTNTTQKNFIVNNTVFLSGSSSGNFNSYCFQKAHISDIYLRNNIFINTRYGSYGTYQNYAIGNIINPLNNQWNCDYNILASVNSSTLGEWGAGWNQSVSQWKALLTTDNNSLVLQAGTGSNLIDPTTLFVNTSAGNLDINTASNMCWYANGKGIATFLNTDIAGNSRNTIQGYGIDIGSNEFNTSTTPIAAIVLNTPVLNGVSSFTFGNDTVCKIYWGSTGTVPSAVNLYNYTGIAPPDPTNNGAAPLAKYLNSYMDIQPTGGSGYSYKIDYYYKDALLGNLGGKSNMILGKKVSSSPGTWSNISSTNDNVRNILSSGGYSTSNLSIFTGTHSTYSLPVELISFYGIKKGNSVNLVWETSSELNNKGFNIQRSDDGNSFYNLGFVKSNAVNSSITKHYEFYDTNPLKNNYYRLEQIDLDGKKNLSQIIEITYSLGENNSFTIYPNPNNGIFDVKMNNFTRLTNFEIYDVLGNKVYEDVLNSATVKINLSNLHLGVYFFRCQTNEGVINKKIVIE